MAPAYSNDRVLLDQTLQQRQTDRDTPLQNDYAFELFSCEQALRSRDVSIDEISDGAVGGGLDGGIDGIYVFLNGELIAEDSDVLQPEFTPMRSMNQSTLELWLIQAKTEISFSEIAIEKVADSCTRLFDLSASDDDLKVLYSGVVVERTGYFRKALTSLASQHPQVVIRFVYAARGDAATVNTRVEARAESLRQQFEGVVTGAIGAVEFLGASELWTRAEQHPDYSMSLTCQEYASNSTGESYVALVTLHDYFAFLRDESGNLKGHIFDWNVRDYQGAVEVNKEIRESLASADVTEFWWLNNGVTVLCSQATVAGKKFQLDNVQIVNGLQTSHAIYKTLSNLSNSHPTFNRSILVRLIVTEDPDTRDKVIRATNKQTAVPDASLRATDPIQRQIEAYFADNGWFYDRRKNYYRNEGRSAEKIVGIPHLAQAIMAMGMSRPDHSRARPSSLLKKDDEYKALFSSDLPLKVYLWLAVAQKAVDSFLLGTNDVTTPERTNLKFYVSMLAVAKLAGEPIKNPHQLISIVDNGKKITDVDLTECLAIVRLSFTEYAEVTGDSADKIAKGPNMANIVLARGVLPTISMGKTQQEHR